MKLLNSRLSAVALIVTASLGLSACGTDTKTTEKAQASVKAAPSLADVDTFLAASEAEMVQLLLEANRAEWIYANFITEDTASLAADIGEKLTAAGVRLATDAAAYAKVPGLSDDQKRKLEKLTLGLTLPAPADAKKTTELSKIVADLGGMYGKGKYCREDGSCMSLGEMTAKMATSRDYDEQLEMWKGWRTISPDMRPLYERQVELTNQGSQELGYPDTGAMWRAKYDMPADEFAKELDRLWGQVKPLYDALHCHVRAKLGETYGEDKVPQDQPIPAHLLGNMWAQQWGNIYDLVAPENADPGYDVTALLEEKGYSEIDMVKSAEKFFTSLGFEPLPDTFWTRSLFLKPKDRDVVCHASAWDLDAKDDIRIKMCIQKTGEEFSTIHHELGHNFYQRAYKNQPVFYQESANDGFHEAIGDTIALSVTPGYLKQIGMLEQVPDASKDIGLLMQMAMDKVAFIPFGLLVDQWRWQVFSGEIKPENYNQAWWDLRQKYQGVMAPETRGESFFDPGAKYHVPGNTPYTRYFLAHILQFQFHRELCKIAGDTGPVHRCSIYNSKEAGKALNTMLEMGSSKPWQDALFALTGSKEMDATAILDYFAPLKDYLDKQNQGRQCGW